MRLEPVPADQLPPDLQQLLQLATQQMGFAPNDLLVMAHWPELLRVLSPLVFTVWAPGAISMELKRLVGLVSSVAGGCQYCVAHNAHGLALEGISPERQAAVWEFESSPMISPAERAALRVARGGGQSPNGVTDNELQDLKAHFSPREIAEIVAVISLFGFLNRWNATLRVPLEEVPGAFAQATLTRHGWAAGPHAGD
ncbi:MAG: carboxymuconolactone decarboxylase family protein [Gammaproteobacteria bacterium]